LLAGLSSRGPSTLSRSTENGQEEEAMQGGCFEGVRRCCAQRCAVGLLGGMLMGSAGLIASSFAEAAERPASLAIAATADQQPADEHEKSIIVPSEKGAENAAPPADLPKAAAADVLEPIANAEEYAPDLADEPAGTIEPTPVEVDATSAEPRATKRTVEAQHEPTSDGSQLQAASFSGVTPGATTRAEVLSQWSDPLESQVGGKTLTYEQENFPSIVVTFKGDRVDSVRVQLFEPAKPRSLIARLGLSEFRSAVIADETGSPVRTLFPERGVTLNHRPTVGAAMATDSKSAKSAAGEGVFEIVMRPIEASPFMLRAERAPESDYNNRIADLETAITLDGKSARAHWMLSRAKLAVFQAVEAERFAAEAVELEPENDEIRLQWAKCLTQLARYEQALEQTRAVLESKALAPIVRAEALEQMAVLASLGSQEVQQRAVPLHNKAIAMASALTKSDDADVRTAANRVLLAAHLAVAERIATGDWQNKDETVEQWISRASAIAETMIAAHQGDVSLRLQVADFALAAGGRLSPPINPEPWVAEAEGATADLEPTLNDSSARDLLNWRLGLAYYYAAEIQHRRGESDLAIKYGELADATLTPLAEPRSDLPDTAYVLGRLYFQIGAVYAVHRQDHQQACQWYDRGADILVQDVPLTPLANPGQHGDALVSMGVSYWEVGQRDRAYELTQIGVELVQQGISDGLLAGETLSVPQGNLDAMARALGKLPAETTEPAATDQTQMARNPNDGMKRNGAVRQQTRMADRREHEGVSRR
jgi:tetratricopeptide (TPR) repeat protein